MQIKGHNSRTEKVVKSEIELGLLKKYNICSSMKEYYGIVDNRLSKGTNICSQSLKSQLFSCPCS
jgi:hypothetical protein